MDECVVEFSFSISLLGVQLLSLSQGLCGTALLPRGQVWNPPTARLFFLSLLFLHYDPMVLLHWTILADLLRGHMGGHYAFI
jgi:hypothetical protein